MMKKYLIVPALLLLVGAFIVGGPLLTQTSVYAAPPPAAPAPAAPTSPAPSQNGPSLQPSTCNVLAPDCNKYEPQACASGTPSKSSATQVNNIEKCVTQNCIIVNVINPLIRVFSIMVGVVAVIMFIIAGIIYSTSQDDSQKVGLSKKIILSTVLGIVTYVFLFAFLGFLLPEGLSNGSPSDAAVAACKQASSQGFYHV